jgi:hypothetical protein
MGKNSKVKMVMFYLYSDVGSAEKTGKNTPLRDTIYTTEKTNYL